MGINPKCPRCGSDKVQLTAEKSKHGCLKLFFFGIFYFIWLLIKWSIGLVLLVIYDWWMWIIHSLLGKGHVWQCRKWISNRRRMYYCHSCGHNFIA